MSWLAAPFLKVPLWAWLLGALVLATIGTLAAAVWIADNAVEDAIGTAKEAGAAEQTAKNLETTVERVEHANEARDEIVHDRGNARYEQCLRTARTPANCQRLLRSEPPHDR